MSLTAGKAVRLFFLAKCALKGGSLRHWLFMRKIRIICVNVEAVFDDFGAFFLVIFVNEGGTMEQGKVKFFNQSKGFGFITKETGGEIFFHKSNVKNTGFRDTLLEGDIVEFEIKEELKGTRAFNISRK